ncbi:uncharacterized protein LOC135694684 isoform X2 [Rhopilema esculentum]|uniref:uncharacterized protein LOC135694684 isoform X2 n=1 Tax=Rhopilema esculentum TaxID=499914 RepID=UPI0031E2E35C
MMETEDVNGSKSFWDAVEMIATLGFVTGSELGKDALECLSGVKILHEIYKRMNQDEDKLAALRASTILRIAEYVKKNPGANDDQIARQVQKEIDQFTKTAAEIVGK